MLHKKRLWILPVVIAVIQSGCGMGSPERPANVPADAIRIPETKGTDIWQKCSYEKQSSAVRCQIFNVKGDLFHDEIFVPYTGQAPKNQQDLQIVAKGGPDWVVLANGTVLIPQSQYERIKNFLDWQNGKRPRP